DGLRPPERVLQLLEIAWILLLRFTRMGDIPRDGDRPDKVAVHEDRSRAGRDIAPVTVLAEDDLAQVLQPLATERAHHRVVVNGDRVTRQAEPPLARDEIPHVLANPDLVGSEIEHLQLRLVVIGQAAAMIEDGHRPVQVIENRLHLEASRYFLLPAG